LPGNGKRIYSYLLNPGNEKNSFLSTTRRTCGYTVTDLRNGFFIYSRLHCGGPGKTVFLQMVSNRIYIINRLRFYSFSEAVVYATGCGWKITGWTAAGLFEIILTVTPLTVGKSSTNSLLYETK